jgi:hypothetical protein
VNNIATIELPADTPERFREIVGSRPEIEVRSGPEATLRVDDRTYPLAIVPGVPAFAQGTSNFIADLVGRDKVLLVVSERLLPHVRRELEDAGCSYVDGTGGVHLRAPGVLVHLEPRRTRGEGAAAAPPGLGAVAVRAIQDILGEPDREWAVVDLADVAKVSTGQAHNVLQRLEREGLMLATGKGPGVRRRVQNPTDLLDWMARVPAARKIHERRAAYLYASDPDALITRLSFHAHESGQRYAVTGTAGARVMGVSVVTALPVAMVRVPRKPGLVEVARLLGAEPVDTGPNLSLIADVGDVGTHKVNFNGPVAMAPPVRIWLDMLGEQRGEDAAALFREAVIGY